jgi:hypothetical protein
VRLYLFENTSRLINPNEKFQNSSLCQLNSSVEEFLSCEQDLLLHFMFVSNTGLSPVLFEKQYQARLGNV